MIRSTMQDYQLTIGAIMRHGARIWSAILDYGEDHEIDLSSLRIDNSGGSAAPRILLERFGERYGLRIVQGWGMTEMSPVGGLACRPRA